MRVDLYRTPILGPVLRSEWPQRAVQIGLLLGYLALAVLGWGRDGIPGIPELHPRMYTHATTLLFWVFWMMGLVLLVLGLYQPTLEHIHHITSSSFVFLGVMAFGFLFGLVTISRVMAYLLKHQTENGSWALYYGDGGELSTTIECYFALRLAGRPVASTDEHAENVLAGIDPDVDRRSFSHEVTPYQICCQVTRAIRMAGIFIPG